MGILDNLSRELYNTWRSGYGYIGFVSVNLHYSSIIADKYLQGNYKK
jgi:hypothetical protein